MFEMGSGSKTGKDLSFSHEINVLLVIHDRDYLVAPSNLLESCSYKVTRAGNSAAALSILLDGKFDLVFVDVGLTDFDAFKLVKIIVRMNLQAMLLCRYEDDALRSKALASGASMLVKRPLKADVLKHIRQIVLRERVPMSYKYDESKHNDCEIIGESRIQSKGKHIITTSPSNGKQIMENRTNQNGFLPNKERRYRKHSNRDQEFDLMPANNKNGVRKVRRTPIVWTQALHNKFMAAVDFLGEGGCYPKEILKVMSVRGLSRWQVASHLQKCRNNDWHSPEERRSSPVQNTHQISGGKGRQSNYSSERRPGSKGVSKRGRPERFGRYPSIGLQAEPAVHKGSQSNSITNNGIGANCNDNDNYTTLERSKLRDYDHIFSDLGSDCDFSQINGRTNYEKTRENHVKHTFDQQESATNKGVQTMGMSNDLDVADYEISNDNFNILESTEPAGQYYDPIFSDLGELTMLKSNHSSSLTNDPQQTHDDFHNFLLGMDDIYPNMIQSRLPDEPIVHQNPVSQYSDLFGFNNTWPGQDPSAPNRDMNGDLWAGACTSLFRRPDDP